MRRFEPIAFEIHVNGERVCVAGIAGSGVLSAVLSAARRLLKHRPEGLPDELWVEEELNLQVGGIVNGEDDDLQSKRVKWPQQQLKPGDEIRIIVTNNQKTDPPREMPLSDSNEKGNANKH